MFYCYIIKSTVDGSLYKSQTENLIQRIKEHNSGKSQYTSKKLPWVLVYYEEFNTRENALKREKYFKSAAGRRFLKKLSL